MQPLDKKQILQEKLGYPKIACLTIWLGPNLLRQLGFFK